MDRKPSVDMRKLARTMHAAWAKMEAFDAKWDAMPESFQDDLTQLLDEARSMIEAAYWLGFEE